MSVTVGPTAWVNGAVVPIGDATIPLMSNAVFRGTSVFDVMSVIDVGGTAHAVGMSPHLERFFRSADEMGLVIEPSVDDLAGAIAAVLPGVSTPAVVRIVAANAGPSAGRSTPADIVVAVTAETTEQHDWAPLRLCTTRAKIDREVLPPSIKVAATYAAGLRAEARAFADGFDGIVNVSADGYVLEGVSAAVGLVFDDALRFPPLTHVLDSISRRLLIDIAHHSSIDVELELTPVDMLDRCSGAFVASTTRPIVPVTSIDDRRFGSNDPIVSELVDKMRQVLAGQHELSAPWLTAVGTA